MVRTKQGAASTPSTNNIDNAIAPQKVELRRSTRKRKPIFYGESGKEPRAKKAKNTKTESAKSTIAETEAAPSLEPLSFEGFGDSAVETALSAKGWKKQKQVDEMEHIGDTPSQQTDKSTMVKSEAAEVATTTHLIADAPRYEPVKSEEASASTQVDIRTAPIVTGRPLMGVVPKLAPKEKTRRLKTMTNEMEIDYYGEEVRKKDYLDTPDVKYAARKGRALSQHIRFVDRERCDTADAPMERYIISGSMGNNYTVHFGYTPNCTCPDYIFRQKPCKHIIYVVHKVLKVADPLSYQEAYLSSELHAIFKDAPAAPSVHIEDIPEDPKRKPIEGECPICYMEFEESNEAISYCKAACGNNVHKVCIEAWIKAQQRKYHKASCPYCRHDWVS